MAGSETNSYVLYTKLFHTPILLPKGHRMAGSETTKLGHGNETRLTRGKPFHVTVYGLELNFCIGLVCLLPRRPSSNIHYYLNDN